MCVCVCLIHSLHNLHTHIDDVLADDAGVYIDVAVVAGAIDDILEYHL